MGKFALLSFFYSVVFASSVLGNCPDPWEIYATMPGVEEEEVVLFVLPEGTGSAFSEAQIRDDGSTIDAHIELLVRDAFGVPVPNYPKEDIWLESEDGGLVPCIGGACADADTDQNGLTFWESPLHAGGRSEDPLYVVVDGNFINQPPFAMSFVSADFNSDGFVNLADVGLFTAVFFGEYDFAADLFSDGVLNLADVGRLALGMGGNCP